MPISTSAGWSISTSKPEKMIGAAELGLTAILVFYFADECVDKICYVFDRVVSIVEFCVQSSWCTSKRLSEYELVSIECNDED